MHCVHVQNVRMVGTYVCTVVKFLTDRLNLKAKDFGRKDANIMVTVRSFLF